MLYEMQKLHAINISTGTHFRFWSDCHCKLCESWGCCVGSLNKTQRQVCYLWCSEWEHVVSKCPLTQFTAQSSMARQRFLTIDTAIGKPTLSVRREGKAGQEKQFCSVAYINTSEASPAI